MSKKKILLGARKPVKPGCKNPRAAKSGCELGQFRKAWLDKEGSYLAENCGEPVARTVAGVGICAHHAELLDAIAREAKDQRHPIIERPYTQLLRAG